MPITLSMFPTLWLFQFITNNMGHQSYFPHTHCVVPSLSYLSHSWLSCCVSGIPSCPPCVCYQWHHREPCVLFWLTYMKSLAYLIDWDVDLSPPVLSPSSWADHNVPWPPWPHRAALRDALSYSLTTQPSWRTGINTFHTSQSEVGFWCLTNIMIVEHVWHFKNQLSVLSDLVGTPECPHEV